MTMQSRFDVFPDLCSIVKSESLASFETFFPHTGCDSSRSKMRARARAACFMQLLPCTLSIVDRLAGYQVASPKLCGIFPHLLLPGPPATPPRLATLQ